MPHFGMPQNMTCLCTGILQSARVQAAYVEGTPSGHTPVMNQIPTRMSILV